MTPQQFLKAVWPTEGFYCIAIPGEVGYRHFVRETIDQAVAVVERHLHTDNIFFCMHSLREEQVWNPDKINRQTGEPGAWEKRTQRNTAFARCFFMDLDVGPEPAKYEGQEAALAGLIEFTKKAHLPKPMVTSSGGGLHVYWLLTDDVPSEEWHVHANKLRQLAKHYGLKFDPTRITDRASVLRVVGSFNYKKGLKRPVTCLFEGVRSPTGEFLKQLSDAVIHAGVTIKELPRHIFLGKEIASGFEDNISANTSSPLPPPTVMALAESCKLMQHLLAQRGDVSEPEWHKGLNILRFVQDGRKICHKWSEGYANYDAAATDAKIDRLEAYVDPRTNKPLGPTTCATLAETAGTDEHCHGCPFAGRNTSPIQAARSSAKLPPPEIRVQLLDDGPEETITLPDPPPSYRRVQSGIAMSIKDGNDDERLIQILDCDLYPVRRQTNELLKVEHHHWRAHLPRGVVKDFQLAANALYDTQLLATGLSHNGVFPSIQHLNNVKDFMISYIKQLQKAADADRQLNHLGWNEDRSGFALPSRMIMGDGTVRQPALSEGVQSVAFGMEKAGTLDEQVKLLRIYNDDAFLAHQFYILASLAPLVFHATGQAGCVVHATGDTGASKSTALFAAASLWGHPKKLAINGTRKGATELARMEEINLRGNVPTCIDEFTAMSAEEVSNLALGISQFNNRTWKDGKKDGVKRKDAGQKASVLLTTGNTSLHEMLSQRNSGGGAGEAGSMRVIELMMRRSTVRTKQEADDFLWNLCQNHGHIGELAVAEVVRNLANHEERVRAMDARIYATSRGNQGERFWGGAGGSILVMGEDCYRMGLLSYDPEKLFKWYVHEQIPAMRGVLAHEYSSPAALFAAYLDSIDGNILVTTGGSGTNKDFINPIREPHGQLLAHYDLDTMMMYVARKGWRDWCARCGVNPTTTIRELAMDRDKTGRRLIINDNYRRVLGAGTNYAKLQTTCIVIDMRHADVAGVVDAIRTRIDAKDNRPTVH